MPSIPILTRLAWRRPSPGLLRLGDLPDDVGHQLEVVGHALLAAHPGRQDDHTGARVLPHPAGERGVVEVVDQDELDALGTDLLGDPPEVLGTGRDARLLLDGPAQLQTEGPRE